jgi:hypothetical protein
VDVCPSDLKEEELLNPRGRDRVLIDERLWSSVEFAVSVTAWLAHRSVHCDQDYRKVTCQPYLLSPSSRAAAPPSFVALPVLVARLCGTCGPGIEGDAPATFVHFEPTFYTMPVMPDLSRELTANPPSTCNHEAPSS